MDSAFTLLPIAFLTSTLTGAVGMGGGMLLIAVMPGLMPMSAVLPVHAATQLASNVSRAAFGWRSIDWSLVPPLVIGGTLGALVGGSIYERLDLSLLPAIMGLIILCLTWLPAPKLGGSGRLGFVLLGFYQTGLGMLIGATGPVGGALLARRSSDRDYLVVNTGVYMTTNHTIRVIAFALLGFSFHAWWWLLLGLVTAVTAGSWLGTRLRHLIPADRFHRWFRWLLTLLALRLLALGLFEAGLVSLPG
jgi:uncharacterized membrane protein YfcA